MRVTADSSATLPTLQIDSTDPTIHAASLLCRDPKLKGSKTLRLMMMSCVSSGNTANSSCFLHTHYHLEINLFLWVRTPSPRPRARCNLRSSTLLILSRARDVLASALSVFQGREIPNGVGIVHSPRSRTILHARNAPNRETGRHLACLGGLGRGRGQPPPICKHQVRMMGMERVHMLLEASLCLKEAGVGGGLQMQCSPDGYGKTSKVFEAGKRNEGPAPPPICKHNARIMG